MDGKHYDIVMIDSGISSEIIKNYRDNVGGIISFADSEDCLDVLGHGSAVFHSIMKENIDKSVFVIQLFKEKLEVEEATLLLALEYISDNIFCEIVHLSLGIVQCENKARLYELCKKIHDKGIIIVSAFDNMGAISYPAAFPFVLGVDTGVQCTKKTDYYVVSNSIVNVLAYGAVQRVAWNDSLPFAFVSGSSFAAANITSILLKNCKAGSKIEDAIALLTKDTIKLIEQPLKKGICRPIIHKAIALPVNKEILSLINYQELLAFELCGIYDFRRSGNVNNSLSSIYKTTEFQVLDADQIKWEGDFDTVVISHISELELLLRRQVMNEIIIKCIDNKKNIYSFDSLDKYSTLLKNSGIAYYYPTVTNEYIGFTFGKLALLNTPVLGVFGTSSQQGKYTLQLYLKKVLQENGYALRQLGQSSLI